MVKTTKAQRHALLRKFRQTTIEEMPDRPTYKSFRKSIEPVFFADGAIAVQWCGMWLCIEKDGYTHT